MDEAFDFEEKLKSFLKLSKDFHSKFEDDTVMQKLQTAMQEYILSLENGLAWSEDIGLITFICESLDESAVNNEKNFTAVGLALHCLSAIVSVEEMFLQLQNSEVIENFKMAIPHIRENMSLASNSLKVVESLLKHSAGLNWILKNGLWENLLIASLRCQSLFVRKDCVSVITSLLLNIKDTKTFTDCIHDLELVLYKFREKKYHLKVCLEEVPDEYEIAASIAKLQFNSSTVIHIFYSLLTKSLGKMSLYSQLKAIFDLTSKILFRFNFPLTSEFVVRLSKMLLLSTLHRFQDQILKFGTVEQYHLDSVTSDLLSLTRHMTNKGLHSEFLQASFQVHEYWNTMCTNISETNEAELSKCLSILFILMNFQIIPLRVICSSSLDMGTEADRRAFEANYASWKKAFLASMCIREEQKNEMNRLVYVLREKYASDAYSANKQCISHLTHFASLIEYIHPKCASTLLQALLFLLKFKVEATSTLEQNPSFYLHAMNLLKLLIERFEADWDDYFEFQSLLSLLCSVVWIPGITTRVKVSTLKTISACVRKLAPSVLAQMYSRPMSCDEFLEDLKFNKLAETLTIYLSDTEWEVRDSALELILICLKVHEEDDHPALDQLPFYKWAFKHQLFDFAVQLVGDVEAFVQASAIAVLAASVSQKEVWPKLKNIGIKQKAVRGVARSGESCVRKAGLELIKMLLLNSKFEPAELNKYVIPVIQLATVDPDDEVRLGALKLIDHHLNLELMLTGMIDGEFPKVTFQNGKITNLVESEVQERILSLVCSFSNNGYLQSVVNCLDDNSTSVRSQSNSILCTTWKLIDKYQVQTLLENCLHFSEIPPHSSRNSSDEEKDMEATPNSPVADEEREDIDFVLDLSDISVISRLHKDFRNCENWWSGDPSEPLLREEEVVLPSLPKFPSSTFFSTLQKVQSASQQPVDEVKERKETILLLLEDIFLVIRSQGDNESRSRDCY